MVSFIIPAHNEERMLSDTLDAVHQSAAELNESYEVIVVDDASTDATARVAKDRGAQVVHVEFRQISRTRNAGADAARGEVLIFVDADTIVNRDVVRAATEAIANGAVGGGCMVRFEGRVPLYARLTLPLLIFSFRVLKLAAGCFVFCRRDAFQRVGGFSDELYASEEVALSRALGREGRFIILHESVLTSGRKVRTHSMWEIMGILLRVMMFWRRPLKKRDGLELWYGPRRVDPDNKDKCESGEACQASSR